MTVRRTDAFRNAEISVLNTQLGANALFNVRTGVNAGIGGQGVLLATLTGNAAGWGTALNGVLTSNAITPDSSADATGTVGHYERLTSAAVFLESGLLDQAGTDGFIINNPSIVAGQEVAVSGNLVETAAYDDGI